MSEELIWHLKQEVDWLVFSGGFRQQIQANSQPSGLKNLPSHLALSSPGIKHLCCCNKSVMHYRWKRHFMLPVTTVQLKSSRGFRWMTTEKHRGHWQHQLLSRCPYSATESKPRNETQAQTVPGKITWKPRCFSLSRKACDLIKTNGVIQKAGSTREDKFLI